MASLVRHPPRQDLLSTYAQLVESVRCDPDGVPVHQVIANFGRVTDPVQLENLKAAFAANRSGQRLAPVVASTAESTGSRKCWRDE
ncbi:hypothetical protein ACFL5O_01380 [Myxococcota bacterium]